MLITIQTTHSPATDLGFLLHKHPDKYQIIDLPFGKAHVFYPIATADCTQICLILEVDPVDLVRERMPSGSEGFSLAQYVNDRPYVASSFMSVAIAKAFSTALNGKCTAKPELVGVSIPLRVELTAVAAPRGGESLIRKLFEPLGYSVQVQSQELDSKFPEWGQSKYFGVCLEHTLPIGELLQHLYVLIPVLDNEKHYFVDNNEVEKLLAKGGEWLKNHPHKPLISSRYLFNLSSLTRKALERLEPELFQKTETDTPTDATDTAPKRSLHEGRLDAVASKLLELKAEKVLDLGCGEGKLIKRLLQHSQFTKILGMDVVYTELLRAKDRLRLDTIPPKMRERVALLQGSVLYRDKRLEGFDAAVAVEVIEHLEPTRLGDFAKVLFEHTRPRWVLLTTPNREYNQTWEGLDADDFRHSDHRFEWTRAEFAQWANSVAAEFAYSVAYFPLGEELPEVGAPTQMAVFQLLDTATETAVF